MCFDQQQFLEDSEKYILRMKQEMPETVTNFYATFRTAMGKGELSFKEKELIALGISLSLPCAPSVVDHTKKALAAGATREEILETASVSIFMAGNTAFNHTPLVIKTLDTLKKGELRPIK